MQNPIQKFRQSSIVFEKPCILSENLKTLMDSNYPRVQYFLLKLSTSFLLTSIYKRVCGTFFILFRSWVINKNVKNECVETRPFYFLQITQDLNKIKNPTYPFVDIGKSEMCGKFQQKIFNWRVVGAGQSFQMFRQNTWFLGNNRALYKFLCGIIKL